MLCEICQTADATVCLIETVNHRNQTLNICESCAQKKHLDEMLTKPALAIHELLLSIIRLEGPTASAAVETACPTCGTTFEKFKQVGQLGCPDCYSAFRENLLPLFRQFHQAEEHHGRGPGGRLTTTLEAELQALQAQLKQAIIEEKFELAAQLRDQLRQRGDRT